MAYTFGEARAAIQKVQQQGLLGSVRACVVVTQDDSRTAWSRGNLYLIANDTLGNLPYLQDPNIIFNTRFSDRNYFSGQMDLVGLNVVEVGVNQYRGDFVLYSWGSVKISVDLTPAPQGKMLMGWGAPIGYLPHPALHCVSFGELIREVPIT